MAKHSQPSYQYVGIYDHTILRTEFTKEFGKNPRYNLAAIPQLFTLLDLIERDAAITDVRWAAYMLATVMWETTVPTTTMRPAVNKKGKPLMDRPTDRGEANPLADEHVAG